MTDQNCQSLPPDPVDAIPVETIIKTEPQEFFKQEMEWEDTNDEMPSEQVPEVVMDDRSSRSMTMVNYKDGIPYSFDKSADDGVSTNIKQEDNSAYANFSYLNESNEPVCSTPNPEIHLEVLTSNKGGEKLYLNGYTYHLNLKPKNNIYRWICTWRRSHACCAKVTTCKGLDGIHFVKIAPTNHLHQPVPEQKDILRAYERLKNLATTSDMEPLDIINDVIQNCPEESRSQLPSERSQRLQITRLRTAKDDENSTSSENDDCEYVAHMKNIDKQEAAKVEANLSFLNSTDEGVCSKNDIEMEVELEVFKTKKGCEQLYLNGYTYRLMVKPKNNVYRWICTWPKSHACYGKVTTFKSIDGNHLVKIKQTEHWHHPLPYKRDLLRVYEKLKHLATTTDMDTLDIIQNAIQDCPEESRPHLPSETAQRQTICRLRGVKCEDMMNSASGENEDCKNDKPCKTEYATKDDGTNNLEINLEVFKTNKGGEKLYLNGYTYYLMTKSKDNKCRWICTCRKSESCNGKVTTIKELDGEHILYIKPSEHSHRPYFFQKDVLKANEMIRDMTKGSDIRHLDMIEDSVQNSPEMSQVLLTSQEAQRRQIARLQDAINKKLKRVRIAKQSEGISKEGNSDSLNKSFESDQPINEFVKQEDFSEEANSSILNTTDEGSCHKKDTEMQLEVFKTNKGREQLYLNGYTYHLNLKPRNNVYRWICSWRKSHACYGKITTLKSDDETHSVQIEPTDHWHQPHPYKRDLLRVNEKLRIMATTTDMSPLDIIKTANDSCPEESRVHLPTEQAQRHAISRLRAVPHEEGNSTSSENDDEGNIDVSSTSMTECDNSLEKFGINLEIFKTNQGGEKLYLNGYTYHMMIKPQDNKYRWICTSRRSDGCHGKVTTIKTEDGEHLIQIEPSVHCHEPLVSQKEVLRANERLKDMSRASDISASDIIENSVQSCPEESRLLLPSKETQLRKIKRMRAAINGKLKKVRNVKQIKTEFMNMEENAATLGESSESTIQSETQLEVFKTNKGGEKLFLNGYTYYLMMKPKDNKYRWTCTSRKFCGCHGKVTTIKSPEGSHSVQIAPAYHSHPPVPYQKDLLRANEKIKNMSTVDGIEPSEIIQAAIESCPEESRVLLQSEQFQLAKIARIRNRKRRELLGLRSRKRIKMNNDEGPYTVQSIEIFKSNKGGEKLFLDGYTYHLMLKPKDETYRWICISRKSHSCFGKVTTLKTPDGSHSVKLRPSEHCHEPLPYQKDILRANEKIKNMSIAADIDPSQIIQDAIESCPEECRVLLPSAKSQLLKITRMRAEKRKKHEGVRISKKPKCEYSEGEYIAQDIEIFTSNKGGEKLYLDGHTYHLMMKGKNNVYRWSCTSRKSDSCLAKVSTVKLSDTGHSVKLGPSEHTHPPVPEKMEVLKAKEKLKDMTTISDMEPSDIIEGFTQSFPEELRMHMPSKQAQRRTISRIRASSSKETNSFSNGSPADEEEGYVGEQPDEEDGCNLPVEVQVKEEPTDDLYFNLFSYSIKEEPRDDYFVND